MEFAESGAPDALDAFTHTLELLSELMASITLLEEAKADAASARQHQKIEDLLKEEQALILKLRGTEQLRIKQADALGWGRLTFSQILTQASEEQQRLLSPLFEKLSGQLRRLMDSKDSAERILKVRLKEFKEALAGAPQPHFHDTYV